MLPDIADGGGEHDVAARRARVARDIFHLVEEDLLRVDRKSGFALVAEIDVILRVGYHRDGEGVRVLLRRSGRREGGGGEGDRQRMAKYSLGHELASYQLLAITRRRGRSEEHTSELQSLMHNTYA